ncbi:hypothetical protein IQ268_30295 [Oculatella sp. LEGE 06141]|uniref:RuBisCO accumulation factor 1 n=1 Tax=Oculatella sp. LEGE 06141 TaxID=1828648 RepID=UPI00187EB936|nr:RuBisCO accumulation factor 1 [Oculatella sp. LEGE 06141]MBE9182831.1 hypothetical protein [Oculatella sp. LEGE 06141]
MTTLPPEPSDPKSPNHSPAPELDTEALLQSLRRKEGTWADWGTACQQLQKAGYTPQQIFEETGFEPIQQNQIIVAAQVFHSMLGVGISDAVRSRFEESGSDTLYEFRILTQADRVAAATLVVEKGLDAAAAHEVAKALQDFARLSAVPEGFTQTPGDAIAYRYWNQARQQSDLQARSRLIAQALRFAHSDSARQKVETLLTDFTVARTRPVPRLPFYRLDSEEDLPRVLPVVGKLPLTLDDLKSVPLVVEEGSFRMVKFSGAGAWVPIPGWQVVLKADDPVVILASSAELPDPDPLPGKPEDVLVLVDRAARQWHADSYFLVEQDGHLEIRWFDELPNLSLLGQVVLILRPKKVLDEEYTTEIWQIDE